MRMNINTIEMGTIYPMATRKTKFAPIAWPGDCKSRLFNMGREPDGKLVRFHANVILSSKSVDYVHSLNSYFSGGWKFGLANAQIS